MVDAVEIWDRVFRDTVEGKPGPLTARLQDGKPTIEAVRIEDGAQPRPELVIELLRSGVPLSSAMRDIIADWLAPNAGSAFCYKSFGRRKAGRYPLWEKFHMEAAMYVDEHFDAPGTYESAVRGAMDKFGLKRTTVTDAHSQLRDARAEECRVAKLERSSV